MQKSLLGYTFPIATTAFVAAECLQTRWDSLTPNQRVAAFYLANSTSNEDVAAVMKTSIYNVKYYAVEIYRKTGVCRANLADLIKLIELSPDEIVKKIQADIKMHKAQAKTREQETEMFEEQDKIQEVNARQEVIVLRDLLTGVPIEDTAEREGWGETKIKQHRRRIFEKADAQNIEQLLVWAYGGDSEKPAIDKSTVEELFRNVLTPQELQVCYLLLCGYDNKKISAQLADVKPSTVKTYRTKIMTSLNVHSLAELFYRAHIDHGGITTQPAENKTLRLSGRQQEVLPLMLQGLSREEIGARLGITHETVGRHLHSIYRRLNTSREVLLRAPQEAREAAGMPAIGATASYA